MIMALQDELGLSAPFRDIKHEAVLSIVRTANLLSAKAAQLFRSYDLTEAQFNVLFALRFADGNLTQAELGKRLVVTRASITSVLDKLESKKLVERQKVAGNRRIHHVRLTAAGNALLDRVEPPYREEIHRILEGFNEAHCANLVTELTTVRSRLIDPLER
jgi:MarR family 2-MHQ and catechol resistance regulon transcriptional repressor